MTSKLPNENVQVPVGEAYENAHVVQKGDPKIDGPYLDDIRSQQDDEYRRQRNKSVSQVLDEDTTKKKDVPFDLRAKSQKQHDENRYHEEKTVEDSVKAVQKKTPLTPVEKAGREERKLPGTKSTKKKVQKADKFKGKTDGNTPNVSVKQEKASVVKDRPNQPSNSTKSTTTVANPRPEVTTDPVAKEKK